MATSSRPSSSPKRIEKPDVQTLLQKVKVRPDAGFTARYPGEVPSRVTVRLKGGKSYSHEVKDYPGFPTRPFTWEKLGRNSTSSQATASMPP
jgi:2-methylcitrate dehydratase